MSAIVLLALLAAQVGALDLAANVCAHGSLVGDTCVCDPGWAGLHCADLDCRNNGSFSGGVCQCVLGYYGLLCERGPCFDRGWVTPDAKCECFPEYRGDYCFEHHPPELAMDIIQFVLVCIIATWVIATILGALAYGIKKRRDQ